LTPGLTYIGVLASLAVQLIDGGLANWLKRKYKIKSKKFGKVTDVTKNSFFLP